MYRNLIWDFDGTLFDTYPSMAKILQQILLESGIHEEYGDIYRNMKITLGYALRHYSAKYGLGPDFIETFDKREKACSEAERPPAPYAIEVCRSVKMLGGRNFLLTHRERETAENLLSFYGLDDVFSDKVFGDQGFKKKPDPEAFIYLIEKHRLERQLTLSIGDRSLDIEAGRGAGIKGCYLLSEGENSAYTPADHYVRNLREIEGLLR